MEKTLELIRQKKEQYKDFRYKLGHEVETAIKLGFKTEVERIALERRWAVDTIDLLEEIAKKVQSENKEVK